MLVINDILETQEDTGSAIKFVKNPVLKKTEIHWYWSPLNSWEVQLGDVFIGVYIQQEAAGKHYD